MKEVSAGGIVIDKGKVLLLQQFRGGWVLPKGRIEEGESIPETALREVFEESGFHCQILKYIGFVRYNFFLSNGELVKKKVYYYLMKPISGQAKPQTEEGFSRAVFVSSNQIDTRLSHRSEKTVVHSAIKQMKKIEEMEKRGEIES